MDKSGGKGFENTGSLPSENRQAQYDLASTLLVFKRWEEYEALARPVLESQRRLLGPDDPDTLDSLNNLQYMYFQRGRFHDAEPIAKEVLESRRRTVGADHPSTLLALHNLGTVYAQTERAKDAEQLEADALTGLRRTLGDTHQYTLDAWAGLATAYEKEDNFTQAETLLLSAARAVEGKPDLSPTVRTKLMSQIAKMYELWGQEEKAAQWQAQIPRTAGASSR